MRLNHLNRFSCCAALAALPAVALAQAGPGRAPSPDEAGAAAATALSGIAVAANRSAAPIDQTGASVAVLTAPDIRADQETSVGDILARTPGVSFDRNGGVGQTTSLFIRGADSDQTVVLIDGVKLNDPSSPGTGYDVSSLITGDIARIEVLRGPQSTLYDSAAIGGVVNIVTADATKPLEGDLRAEGGSLNTAYVSGGLGGKDGALAWRIGAYGETTAGVSAFDQKFGGQEADAYRTLGASGRLRYDLTDSLQLEERAYYSWSRTSFDGYDTPTGAFGDDFEYGHTEQLTGYTGANLSLLDGQLKNRLAFEYSGVDHNDQDPQQPANYGVNTTTTYVGAGRTYTLEYEGAAALAPGWQAVFGAQSERSSFVSQAPVYEPVANRAHLTIDSGYGQITAQPLPGLSLTGGARYDDQSNVGGHVVGQASAAWRLNDGGTILRASFGQGFKAPSLYQLYSEYGNAALHPEQADGWDAGIEQHLLGGRLMLQATYFGRDTRQLIEFISCYGITQGLCATNVSGGYYANVARARAEGLELQTAWKATDRLQLTANYSFDDSEDRSPGSPTLGYQLARRPKDTANLDAAYVWPVKLRSDLALRYAGQSWDDAAHTIALKGYTLVDVRLSYPVRRGLELYGRVENLTNHVYETAYQYGALRRAFYGGLRLSF
jgi:vitamin B12 transporter